MIPARTRCAHACLLSRVPRVGVVRVSMLRMIKERLAHRYARTRRAIPMLMVFFFLLHDIAQVLLTDRVINAPCELSAPRFLAARAGLHFGNFIGFC
jgi:ABC-type amino acid transport system permease subunit